MSVLAIDIGNTRIGLNVFTAGKAQDPSTRIAHEKIDAELPGVLATLWEKTENETKTNEDEDAAIVIASVVPALTEKIARLVLKITNQTAQLIGRDIPIPIKTALTDEKSVGQDRLLGALAAYVNVESSCVVVHLGTALVVDCIDDEGVFRGGAIAPGLRLAAKALHESTAQLPEITLAPPAENIDFGRNTAEAINLGLHIGLRGAVRELIERYATALNAWPHVVATGGDAQAVLGGGAGGAGDSQLVQSFIPDLVLQGAALAWENDRRD
jgi:type III pantothenate kinase